MERVKELLSAAQAERAKLQAELVMAVLAGRNADADAATAKLVRLGVLIDALTANT